LNTLNKQKILKNLPKDDVTLDIFNTIDSTNEECKRIELKKGFHVIISEHQTMGKGRLGKAWSSPSSGNIYMSIYSKESINEAPLSLIVGLICANVINSMIKTNEVGLKWPNDIILANKKIGGILIEKEVMGAKINNIVGIGINLNHPDKEIWWGDLSSFNISPMRNELINGILKNYIDFCEHGIDSWEEKWHELCVHMNLNIKIKHNEKVIETGLFDGINSDGSLILRLPSNKIINYEHGEISIEGIY
jgi:BirA family biotin operon repressor/biotin-[acetyl-CoA-carboxylase] ligase